MTKQWFVLQILTGQENKVKKLIEARVRIEEMGRYIGEVRIPTEKVTEIKNGVRRTITRKFYPGYVLIQLSLYDEKREVLEPTWRFLKETTGVIGFVGGQKPVPLTQEEVDNIYNQSANDGRDKVKLDIQYEPGEVVEIIDGPFLSFNGTVDEVDPSRGKMKVSVAIFGRSAPVELEYWQVERVVDEAT